MKLRVPYPYIKALSYAMPDADVRPYFNGVIIDPVRGYAAATDGTTLLMFTTQDQMVGYDGTQFCIAAEAVMHIVRGVKARATDEVYVDVSWDERTVQSSTGAPEPRITGTLSCQGVVANFHAPACMTTKIDLSIPVRMATPSDVVRLIAPYQELLYDSKSLRKVELIAKLLTKSGVEPVRSAAKAGTRFLIGGQDPTRVALVVNMASTTRLSWDAFLRTSDNKTAHYKF